jgi:hypothetical protein
MVFPDGILYHKQKGVVRTPRVNSLFEAIPLLAGDSSKNKKSRFIKESASIQQSAQDWMVFAALTHRNKLVLPKVPHGFAVTGFVPFTGLSSKGVVRDLRSVSADF